MKKIYLFCLSIFMILSVFGVNYPASDYMGSNVLNKTSAAAVRATLSVPSVSDVGGMLNSGTNAFVGNGIGLTNNIGNPFISLPESIVATRIQLNSGTNPVVSTNFVGNGGSITNLDAPDQRLVYLKNPTLLLFDGDSITKYNYIAGEQGWVYALTNLFLTNANFIWATNVSQAGRNSNGATNEYIGGIHTFAPGAGTNAIYFPFIGVNSTVQGYGFAQITNQLYYLYTNARADGMKVCAFTLPELGPSYPSGLNTLSDAESLTRRDVNSWIRGNPQLYDYLADVDSILSSGLTTGNVPMITPDGVHYKQSVYQHIAAEVFNAIRGIPLRGKFDATLSQNAARSLVSQFGSNNYIGTFTGTGSGLTNGSGDAYISLPQSIVATRLQLNNGTNTVASTNFVGNGNGITNVQAANLTGTASINTTGAAGSSTISGLITNGDLSINVDAVPQLDTALRYSNQVSVIIFGDSVGNYIWKSAPKLFDSYSTFPTAKGSLRYSGYSADGWGGWLNTLNSGTGPSTYDTVLDSWWGDSQIYVVTSGTTNVWSVGGTGAATGKLNGNLLKFWYFAASTNGTIAVDTSTDGTTWIPRIAQNEATPPRGLVCTNIVLATADYYVRVSANAGRCQYLYPQIINTNTRAFYIANLCAGGRTMADLMNMGTNNIATLLTNMWPPTTLIAYVDTKSIYTYTNWFKVKGLFDTYSTNSDVVVGKPQPSVSTSIEADAAEGTYFQSLVFNDIGRTNKIPFYDIRSSFADTNRSARLNFYANDGSFVHFNVNGQQALSDDFWNRLKIKERLIISTNFFTKTARDMFSVIGSTYSDTAYISNAWANGRSGIYFETPDATAANWAIAGSSSAMGLKSRAGFYVFCNYSTTAGGQWFTSGGLNLWGSGYANNEDPGIGGLVLAGNQTNYGHFAINAVGKKFLVKEGSNAIAGIATLSGGTVVVSTTAVTANSRIQLTPQTLGTVARPAAVGVTARTAGTSFTITSGDATDTSTVAWFIVEPAP